jgi:hypothetical protein
MGYLVFASAIAALAVMLALSGCKKAPKTPTTVSAMCYAIAPPAQTTQYICPKCGMRTLYPAGTDYHITDGINEESTNTLKKLGISQIKLDRSQFCKSCNPDIKDPKLIMIVNYEDGQNFRRIEGIDSYDYRLLFLFDEHISQNKVKEVAGTENKSVEECYTRLSELLGIEIEILKKEAEKETK